MANKLQLKRSAVPGKIPTTADLDLGEIGINTYDGKAYIKKNVSGTESVVPLGGTGSGDVVGPNSSTDNAIVRFDGLSGKLVQNSSATIDDSGNVSLNSLSLTTDLSVTNGGTGASDAATARTNLGAQQSLVSGTNIKTVNGNSILGGGNLVLDSGFSTRVNLTSGTSWTVPAGVTKIRATIIGGGGGGGGGGGYGGTGGTTTFNGVSALGGVGGNIGLSSTVTGRAARAGLCSGNGGGAAIGVVGIGDLRTASDGGGGEIKVEYFTVTPSGSISYSIGAGGTAGAAGSYAAGSAGGAGAVIVEY